ncbi:hypothetical protein BU17DRAFT_92989 [Hysterangium stoloniferum]|nr:hypothetical protein BU17DRAFT_92989 [Hysterangium stoloniferum]
MDPCIELEPPSPPISIHVGIIVGLLASFVQSLGLTIQRKSHIINDSKPEIEQKVGHRRPLWLLGFGIFITSNILGSLFQIASLPVVILAPLGAVSLLWNAFFARLLLGDVFSRYMVLGTFAIAGGAVLIAVFGIVPEPTHSLEDLLVLLRRPPFVVYFSLLGAAVASCLAVTHLAELSFRHRLISPPETPLTSSASTSPSHVVTSLPHIDGFPAPLASETTPLLSTGKPSAREGPRAFSPPSPIIQRTRLLLAVSYSSVSGILSGMCLLFAKSGVELLILTATGDNQFWRWEAWALVSGLVVFAALQLWYLHKSLILANPILVCPLAFCFYNLSSIINGLVYYDQFGALSAFQLWLVVLGIVILLGGVWAVSVTSEDGDGGVEPGTWRERVMEVESLPVSMPSEPSAFHQRHASYPTDRASEPYTATPSIDLPSPMRQRPTRRQRYPSLLGTEGQPGSISGLSIGLSPTSPGFALKPTRRRASQSALITAEREMRMRRAVSEADMSPAGTSTRVRLRWRWLKHVWKDSVTEDQES